MDLEYFIVEENISAVRDLVSRGSLTKRDYTLSLISAIEICNFEIVKLLVEAGADINCLYIGHLRTAAMHGYLDIVKYLVESGADIHAEWDMALRRAAENGKIEVVKYLVSQGTNPRAFGDNALFLASGNGYFNTVKYLLAEGCRNKMGTNSPLREAAINGHFRTVKYLILSGADIKECEDNDTLIDSCLYGSIKFTKWLLTKLNKARTFTSNTNDPEIINKFKYLISQGININVYASLIYCCTYGYLDGVKFLVSNGININMNREEALALAAEENHMDIVAYLIEKGADIELAISEYPFIEQLSKFYLRGFLSPTELFTGILNETTETDCYICYEPMDIAQQLVQCNVCKKCLHLECRNKWRPECIYCRN